jgi:aminoglycoside phosphotransferase (APT) family kinase protein
VPDLGVHGDLWAGNVLTTGAALTGVVDWDSYRSSPVPGIDLMHLVATDERLRHRRSMGAELLSRPWRREPLRAHGAAYFARLGVDADVDRWTAVGVAWWAGQLLDSLSRSPELADDEGWLATNVDGVLAALGG